MRTDEMDSLRLVIQGLTVNGKEPVTNKLLYEAMGLDNEPAKARLRSRINDLIKRAELTRIEDGKYAYNPKARLRSGEFYQRIWRAIRSAKPGFSWTDIAQVSRVSYTHARKYGQWLLDEAFVERHGRKGATYLFRATLRAKDTVETPYPPQDVTDPFEVERNAACRLVRSFMERDPYQPAVRGKIIDNCRAILARFEKEASEDAGEATG